MKRLALIGGLLAANLCPMNPTCPIHDGWHMYFTGQAKFVDGAMINLYACPRGHEVWVHCN